MSDFNPKLNYAKSNGVDLPILKIYLAGKIQGQCINKCLDWQKQIIKYFREYEWNLETEEYDAYPVSFLSALNSKEGESVDKLGLTSCLPANFIYAKDLLSINNADAIIANVDDMMENGIEDLLKCTVEESNKTKDFYRDAFFKLQEKIINRRECWGTISEVSIALYLQKPVILIAPESRKYIYEKHPFAKRASIIISSVEELLEKKWIQILYKSISSSVY